MLAVVALGLLVACGSAAAPAATVGSTSITDQQLATEAKLFTFLAGLQQQPCGTKDPGETQESACNRFTLSNLIQSTLVTEYAGQHNITVTDADLQKTVQGLDSGVGADTVNKALASNGLTRDDLNSLVREVLLFREVQANLAKAQLSDAQLHQLYQQDIGQFTNLDLDHILVKTKAEADRVYAQVTAPGFTRHDFEALAKKVSIDPGVAQNSGRYTQAASGFDQTFATAALALKPGEISKPVQTSFGWHVIRLQSKTVTPYDQAVTQLLQGQGTTIFNTWLQQQSKSEGVSVNPKYGRFNEQTQMVDRITSTNPSATSTPAGQTGGSTAPGNPSASTTP